MKTSIHVKWYRTYYAWELSQQLSEILIIVSVAHSYVTAEHVLGLPDQWNQLEDLEVIHLNIKASHVGDGVCELLGGLQELEALFIAAHAFEAEGVAHIFCHK